MTASADNILIRLLEANEADHVVSAITAAYGDTYEVPRCYDTTEITRRVAHGGFISAAATAARPHSEQANLNLSVVHVTEPGADLTAAGFGFAGVFRSAFDDGRDVRDYVLADLP